jgi:hypothetical protein
MSETAVPWPRRSAGDFDVAKARKIVDPSWDMCPGVRQSNGRAFGMRQKDFQPPYRGRDSGGTILFAR